CWCRPPCGCSARRTGGRRARCGGSTRATGSARRPASPGSRPRAPTARGPSRWSRAGAGSRGRAGRAPPGPASFVAGAAPRADDDWMTWIAPEVKRSEPLLVAGEREALEAWLDFQRETLLVKCSGLTAEQLREHAVPPSRLTLLGLVRHMTDVERWWFRVHGTNQEMAYRYFTEDNLDADFEDLDEPDAPAVLAAF